MASSSDSASTTPFGFQIQPEDNVATMLQTSGKGLALIRCHGKEQTILLQEPIEMGHKIALQAIETGADVVKYGVVIGIASLPIAPGEWVHLHNCRSRLDERSGTLDLHTGLPEDTKYE